MNMVRCANFAKSSKEKLNTNILTEIKLVGVADVMMQVI